MARITLGRTGITAEQNAFGALPIQRISFDDAAALLRRALDGGMDFIDTARSYTDSEEKIPAAAASIHWPPRPWHILPKVFGQICTSR